MTTAVQLRLYTAPPPKPRMYVPAQRCRKCGCTEEQGCYNELLNDSVCSWEEADLCSACTPDSVPGWVHPVVRARARAVG